MNPSILTRVSPCTHILRYHVHRLISKSVESRTYASNGNGGAKASVQITVKSGIDLVTEVDRECEDIIIAELKKTYPVGGLYNTAHTESCSSLFCIDPRVGGLQEHKFVGEETTFSEGAEELGPEPTWVIDPLGPWITIHCPAASQPYTARILYVWFKMRYLPR
jgi:hypothetical protein